MATKMRTVLSCLTIAILSLRADGSAAMDTPGLDANRVVGSVYGKSITATDIGLTGPIDTTVQYNATDKARWDLQNRVAKAFATPIIERFVKNEKITATPAEIADFKKTCAAKTKQHLEELEKDLVDTQQRLAAKDLSAEERASLEKKKELLERTTAQMRKSGSGEPPDAIAQQMIVAWKTERELKRKYGGRVIFQQFGLEALDGRRLLYEEAEKNGDLKFDDPGVRWVFYYYSKMRHTPADEKRLEKPWFFSKEG
ncbi:MAG TPA: hypothetical protein VHU84_17150 [Lacipirellulaceae bacterium]|nr:hypothetical protein [Lacipirellulaceae bacterium]